MPGLGRAILTYGFTVIAERTTIQLSVLLIWKFSGDEKDGCASTDFLVPDCEKWAGGYSARWPVL